MSKAVVLYDYTPIENDELALTEGDVVEIIDSSDEWWECCDSRGQQGLAPFNFLRVMEENQDGLPPGWEKFSDPETGDSYYFNKDRDLTQWEPPVAESATPPEFVPPSNEALERMNLPPGWDMAVDKESGDVYFFNNATGETTWEKPIGRADKPPETPRRKLRAAESNGDMSTLKILQKEADDRISALKYAIEDRAAKPFASNDSDKHLKSSSGREAMGDSEQQTKKGATRSKSVTAKSQPGISPLHELSMDEINRLIEEQVLREVKKREESIMQRVQFMLSNQDDEGENGTVTADIRKKKHKKREAMASSKAGHVATSRSADSKNKGNGREGIDDASLLSDRDDFSARSRPQQPQSVPKPSHRQLQQASNVTDGSNFSPLKPLELALPPDTESSPRHRHQRGAKQLVSPQGTDPMFPPIVKPVRAAVPDSSRDKDEYEDFSQPVVSVVADPPVGLGAAGMNSPHKKDEPRGKLVLHQVHGYSGDGGQYGGSRGGGKNVLWLTDSIIVYPAAMLIVLMDLSSSQQIFFSEHSDESASLALHPDKRTLASGQMGKTGRILAWDSTALLEGADGAGAVLKEMFLPGGVKGVIGLSFTGDGGLLAALGMDENKSIFVLHWEKGEVLASVKLGHVDIFQMGFNPFLYIPLPVGLDGGGGGSPRRTPLKTDEGNCCYTFVSCGTRYVKFWTLRHVRERTDVNALAGNGSQFKGRQIAVPKNKQQWAWKFVLEGNVGLFPKQNGSSPPDMTCFCTIAEPSEYGALPRSRVLTGGANGSVYIWQQLEGGVQSEVENGSEFWLPRGRLLCVVTDVHDGPIYDLDYFTPIASEHSKSTTSEQLHRVITCSKDGLLNVWRFDSSDPTGDASPMEHLTSVNVSNHSVCMGQPRAVSWSRDGSRAIVGTTANCLCVARGKGLHSDIDTSHHSDAVSTAPPGDVRLDMLVHANVGRIRRVASHPLLDVFATIATDKTVRLWSTLSSSQVALTRVASCGTAITFTPDGSAVAVGTDVGEVLILTCTYLQSCLENNAEPALPRRKARWELLGRKFVGSKSGSKGNEKGGARRSAKFEITELKYSPTGDYLAVAGRDKSIHFLSAVHGYKKVGTCKGHSGVITRVDFSDDGTLLQSCDGARETLYWEVPSGKQISDSRVKGTTWFTWSNPMGKPVKGIMNTCDTADSNNHITDLVSINAVHRSNDMKSLLVGGGGNGFTPTNLKLFRFPCTSSAVPKEYSGHASSISDACFLQSDENVVSIGSSDACVLCWKHVAT